MSMILVGRGNAATPGSIGPWQIIAIVASKSEAAEMARDYLSIANPEEDYCPETFELHIQDSNGFYTRIEGIEI